MSLFSSIVAFAKSDSAAKGIPVLVSFLTDLQNSQNALQRATALAKFEGSALAVGAQIGNDILQDLNSTLIGELQSIQVASTTSSTATTQATTTK